jgi:hypothetical protein
VVRFGECEIPDWDIGGGRRLMSIQRADLFSDHFDDGEARLGHPLYTYVGDTAPGQAFGNNLNLNGGLWHEVTVPG